MESRVLPAARRFKELGSAKGGDIPILDVIDKSTRKIQSSEMILLSDSLDENEKESAAIDEAVKE